MFLSINKCQSVVFLKHLGVAVIKFGLHTQIVAPYAFRSIDCEYL